MANFQPDQNKRHNVTYFTFHKSWRGPLKKAIDALKKTEVSAATEADFLDYLKDTYPVLFSQLMHVNFYRFLGPKKRQLPNNREFHIAVMHVNPDPEVRDALFQKREEIAQVTGWYPLVMGIRAQVLIERSRLSRMKGDLGKEIEEIRIGTLETISSIAKNEVGRFGNAFLLQGNQGSIILDTGFQLVSPLPNDLKCIFISHFHGDHADGLADVLESNQPILLSEVTLRSLNSRFSKNPRGRTNLLNNALVIEQAQKHISQSARLRFFPVFHAPGSYGIVIKDAVDRCVIYPGDLCLNNGFYSGYDKFLEVVDAHATKRTWVLLDASSVYADRLEIDRNDTPRAVIDGMIEELPRRNILFISQNVEMLVYSYILAFLQTGKPAKKQNTTLVLSNSLFQLCQSLLGPMLFQQTVQVDPFIRSVIGKDFKDFIESYRVYHIGALNKIAKDEHVMIFITPGDIENYPEVKQRTQGGNVILAGPLAEQQTDWQNDMRKSLDAAGVRNIWRVSSPDWTFHSSEADLLNVIRSLSERKVNTLLFHQSPKRLERFIRENRLDASLVGLIDEKRPARFG